MNKIQCKNVSFKYEKNNRDNDSLVIDNISFEINSKEAVGIIGANGVGKSTLLKLLVGLLDDYNGEIVVDNLELNRENLRNIRSKIGYVFQDSDSQLFMNTVYEDVAFAPINYGYSQDKVDSLTKAAMEKTHISDCANKHIYKLSGGQKKLAAIATILSMEADILLMDEPSVALDPVNRENLINILNELDTAKITASHDLDFIYDTCDRTILLSNGRIAYDGPTKEILLNKELLENNGLGLPLSFRFMKGER